MWYIVITSFNNIYTLKKVKELRNFSQLHDFCDVTNLTNIKYYAFMYKHQQSDDGKEIKLTIYSFSW